MPQLQSTAASKGDRSITLTRDFAAPRALVFDAWTKEEHFRQWFGPRGFAVPDCTMDVRPGGRLHFSMLGPDGTKHWSLFRFHEIDRPARLVFDDSSSDERGNVIPPAARVTTTFEAHDGGTRLTMVSDYATVEERDQLLELGHSEGMASVFECLDAYLATLAA